ncbi:AAA family ATPase [Pleionea litopenaei]|uniref:ATP-binding protein n=1 Tax=Pleionea litopenaei TaxID=3070815 RepID=A0AA51X774_9GAMM|nr:ATP-binding protein [Pleionea sp. HL-JVS1]WMS87908.1 ATP-binding protein [Pleionea sp. HL-JVS1]
MLVKFKVSNFLSFKNEAVLSLVPSREKQHIKHHIYSSANKSFTNLLRTGVIYGANASGKSNFIRAIEFAQKFVVRGSSPKRTIGNISFKLDNESTNLPTCFYFELQIKNKSYSYEFKILRDVVVFEELKEIKATVTQLIFRRVVNDEESSEFTFGKELKSLKKDEYQFINFLSEGTRNNQLFITESVERNSKHFQMIYDWFDDYVRVFTPRSISHGVEFRIGNDKDFSTFLKQTLSEFDPSVVEISTKFLDADSSDIPIRILDEINDEISEDGAVFISNPSTGNRSVVLKSDGVLKLLKICTQHLSVDGKNKVTFDLEEESDGTRRIIELAPLFYELMNTTNAVVAFVDELDRSLHPKLTKHLIELFLKKSTGDNSQLIVSTHDSDLLDQSILRRDEIWLIDKKNGLSELKSLSKEFSPRHDKDIRSEYLKGNYGAVPHFV